VLGRLDGELAWSATEDKSAMITSGKTCGGGHILMTGAVYNTCVRGVGSQTWHIDKAIVIGSCRLEVLQFGERGIHYDAWHM
jgi:hypothetical protein